MLGASDRKLQAAMQATEGAHFSELYRRARSQLSWCATLTHTVGQQLFLSFASRYKMLRSIEKQLLLNGEFAARLFSLVPLGRVPAV